MQVSPKNFIDEVFQLAGIGGSESENIGKLSLFQTDEFSPINAQEKDLVNRDQIFRVGLNKTFAANEANRFNYNLIQGVKNNRFVTAEFLSGVESMAQRLGTRPEYLLGVMSFETGGTFNPGIRNGIGATGLIQFLPSTATDLGTTTDELARMSSTEQLRFVEKYFDQPKFRGKLGTLEGLYTSVLSGQARKNSDDVLFTRGTRAYEQNPLDWNQDGRITAGEAVTPVAARILGGIRAVQQRLVELGFVPKEQEAKFPDGSWGKNTSAALQRFQTANNLPATGLLDDVTGRKLFGLQENPAPTPNSVTPLQRGSQGAEVENLQNNLIRLGFMTEAQKATGAGIFGPQTESALKTFQQSAKLEASGILNAETQKAFRDLTSSIGRTTQAKNESLTKGIQDRLVELGYLTREQVNTGYGVFGPKTEAALKSFQAKNGVQQTGQVGETTYQKLFSANAQRNNSTNTDEYSVATNGNHYTVNPGILMTESLRPRLNQLADTYFRRTGENLHITSGYLPPSRQASAMYDLIVNNGTNYVRNLYANKTAVNEILTAYQNNSGNRNQAISAMTNAISGQVGRGVYISDHLRSRALDVSTGANFRVLSEIVREMGGSILNEGNHFHLEL